MSSDVWEWVMIGALIVLAPLTVALWIMADKWKKRYKKDRDNIDRDFQIRLKKMEDQKQAPRSATRQFQSEAEEELDAGYDPALKPGFKSQTQPPRVETRKRQSYEKKSSPPKPRQQSRPSGGSRGQDDSTGSFLAGTLVASTFSDGGSSSCDSSSSSSSCSSEGSDSGGGGCD